MTKLRITMSQSAPEVGAFKENLSLARTEYAKAVADNSDVLVLSELFSTGYPPQDLLYRNGFVEASDQFIADLAKETGYGKPDIIVGAPYRFYGDLYNAAFHLSDGRIKNIRIKQKLPNETVFDEERYFKTGISRLDKSDPVIIKGVKCGILICHEAWDWQIANHHIATGAEIEIVINASPYCRHRQQDRIEVLNQRIRETAIPFAYLNPCYAQDSLIFEGNSVIMLPGSETPAFQFPAFKNVTYTMELESEPSGPNVPTKWNLKVPNGIETSPDMDDLEADYRAAMLALKDYMRKNGFEKVVFGLSGGIDSALSAAICTDALGYDENGKSNVNLVMMPYEYTSEESLKDARECADNLKAEYQVRSIKEAVEGMHTVLKGIYNEGEHDIAAENIQPRIRMATLMYMSNKMPKTMVIGNSNFTELAQAWGTLYGDVVSSSFCILMNFYKERVFKLAKWRNKNCPPDFLGPKGVVIPENVITKPPTAELKPDQKDIDSLPDYETELDPILVCLVEKNMTVDETVKETGIDRETVAETERKLFVSEFKRQQCAPGPRINPSNSFGLDRRYPISHRFRTA